MRKFIFISLTLLFCLFFITPYNREKPTFASAATTTYTDTTATENFAIGSPNAIESIKSANLIGTPLLELKNQSAYYQFNQSKLCIEWLSLTSNLETYKGWLFSLPNNETFFDNLDSKFNLSMSVYTPTAIEDIVVGSIVINGITYYRHLCQFPSNSRIYLGEFVGYGHNVDNTYFDAGSSYTKIRTLSFGSDLEDFIDFDSNTNFDFSNSYKSLYNEDSLAYKLYDFIDTGSFDFQYQTSEFGIGTAFYKDYLIYENVELLGGTLRLYRELNTSIPSHTRDFSGIYNMYFSTSLSHGNLDYVNYFSSSVNNIYNAKLDFQIYQPTYRTKNSLLIYNFDYTSFLSSVNKVTYRLMKGQDYFDVVYNGKLPNFTEIVINNENVNNILFDEYIYLYFDFENNIINFDTLNNLKAGFDFNFTYWVEPFVIKESVFSNFNYRPSYMNSSIVFTIVPPNLYIPVNAWVHNALIYTCFYMPVVSSILSPFSPLLGGILQSFQLFSSLFPTNSIIMQLFNFMLVYVIFMSLFGIGNKTVLLVSNRINERKTQKIVDDKAEKASAKKVKKVEKYIRKKNKK